MRRIAAFCVVASILLNSAKSLGEERMPLQRFKTEAPLAWSKLVELGSCVEGQCFVRTIDRVTGKVTEQHGPLTFRVNGLLGYLLLRRDGKIRIECQNLDYEFVADQLATGKWEVKQLLWKDRTAQRFEDQPYYDTKDGTLGSQPWQMALAGACRGLILVNTWLPFHASSPTFKIVEASKVADEAGGGDLIRVKFTNNAKRSPFLNVESGEITLDPTRYWQIVEARFHAHQGNEGLNQFDILYQIKNEFEVADDGFPYVARQSSSYLVTLPAPLRPVQHEEDVYETKLALRDRSEITPFRLPAFGLPEPRPEL